MNNLSASECLGEMIVDLTMIMRQWKFFKTGGWISLGTQTKRIKGRLLRSLVRYSERRNYRLSRTRGKGKDKNVAGCGRAALRTGPGRQTAHIDD
jgi:hypothetical protein